MPARRRDCRDHHLRADVAFEFVAFVPFLRAVSPASAPQVHDAIADAIAQAPDSATVVFSISSGMWLRDLDDVLSCCVESVAVAVADWLRESRSMMPL